MENNSKIRATEIFGERIFPNIMLKSNFMVFQKNPKKPYSSNFSMSLQRRAVKGYVALSILSTSGASQCAGLLFLDRNRNAS